MKKLIVFVGEGGCGKTTLIKKLLAEHPNKFKKIVTCTSRSPRTWDGETPGVDYHFLPESHFTDDSDMVIKKLTADGFYYAVRRSDLIATSHHLLITLRLEGIRLLSDLVDDFIVVNISISDELKTVRMQKRGDPKNMIEDRIRIERENRVNINMHHLNVIRLNASDSIDHKIKMILEFIGC